MVDDSNDTVDVCRVGGFKGRKGVSNWKTVFDTLHSDLTCHQI